MTDSGSVGRRFDSSRAYHSPWGQLADDGQDPLGFVEQSFFFNTELNTPLMWSGYPRSALPRIALMRTALLKSALLRSAVYNFPPLMPAVQVLEAQSLLPLGLD